MLWVKDQEAIDDNDLKKFYALREYRNKLAHQMFELLFEGIDKELPNELIELINLRTKIEKWWILNIEIPTNPDFNRRETITEDDITTSSQLFFRVFMDMLSENKDTANFYREFILKNNSQ